MELVYIGSTSAFDWNVHQQYFLEKLRTQTLWFEIGVFSTLILSLSFAVLLPLHLDAGLHLNN